MLIKMTSRWGVDFLNKVLNKFIRKYKSLLNKWITGCKMYILLLTPYLGQANFK